MNRDDYEYDRWFTPDELRAMDAEADYDEHAQWEYVDPRRAS